MELFISVEAQNATQTGIDKVLKNVNKTLSFVTDTKLNLEYIDNYGTEFHSIGIIPTCFEEDVWNSLGWKEEIKISRKRKEADIRLKMDYELFANESEENKNIIFIATIIKSINVLQGHSKGDFKGDELVRDIISSFEWSPKQVRYLNSCLEKYETNHK